MRKDALNDLIGTAQNDIHKKLTLDDPSGIY